MYHLERLWIWLTRLTCCRGFGIQSPSAYSFVRYVVNEHYPYYAYADLCQQLPNISKRERKLGEFFFRLANFAQVVASLACTLCANSMQTHPTYSFAALQYTIAYTLRTACCFTSSGSRACRRNIRAVVVQIQRAHHSACQRSE